MTIPLPNIKLGSTDATIGRRSGVPLDVVVGVIGAFLGRWLFGLTNISLGDGVIPEIAIAFVGALLLLLLVVNAPSGGFLRRPT